MINILKAASQYLALQEHREWFFSIAFELNNIQVNRIMQATSELCQTEVMLIENYEKKHTQT